MKQWIFNWRADKGGKNLTDHQIKQAAESRVGHEVETKTGTVRGPRPLLAWGWACWSSFHLLQVVHFELTTACMPLLTPAPWD